MIKSNYQYELCIFTMYGFYRLEYGVTCRSCVNTGEQETERQRQGKGNIIM